ncbi:MAG: hypothetical protein WCV59_04840 [Parcubacteria group bacterium]|jgi:hypothetical protein
MPYDNERKDSRAKAAPDWFVPTEAEVQSVLDAQREGDEMKRSFPEDYVLGGPYPPLPKGQTIP